MKASASASSSANDRRVVLWLLAALFLLMLAFVIFAPKKDENDPEPTTYNSGSQGIEAAYLLLPELGYSAKRWEQPSADLRNVDAANTTLILTEPKLPVKDVKELRQSIAEFLERGGWVVATGARGALLLPDGKTDRPRNLVEGLCYTKPQGNGALARAGEVPLLEPVRWSAISSAYHVEQRCGEDAVVVRYRVGLGEAIWWSSPMPLTNAGLSDDPSLKLVLASVGVPGRTVLFDEYLHTYRETVTDTLKGLPWHALWWQLGAVAALLLLSFSRRSGPLRTIVMLPRTSPVEFAESMGVLYRKAGATQAATEAARGRLLECLRDQCGIPRELLRGPAPQVAQILTERFSGEWRELEAHLEQAGTAGMLAPKSALRLVQSLDDDLGRLQEMMRTHQPLAVVHG
jgi:hypothetical protein